MDKEPLVDIIILNLNHEQDTVECISSLKKMEAKNYRIVLIDNGSTDGSGFRVKERFKDIELIRSRKNLGFAGGCNLGIKHSLASGAADYILLLNNDAVVDKDLLNFLLEVVRKDEKMGVVGAVNFYYSQPDKIHMVGNRFIWFLGIQNRIRKVNNEFEEMQSTSGCCMLIKKDIIGRTGMFDERFFVYYEEADFCLRVKKAGFKVGAARDAKVWHKINKIIGSKTPKEYYIYTRNQPLFMLKNCPKIFLFNYFIVYFLKVSVRIVYFFITFRRDISTAIWKGLIDFLKGNFGEGRLFK